MILDTTRNIQNKRGRIRQAASDKQCTPKVCTLRLFTRLGSVVICVSALSIVYTLVVLPAVLMVLRKHNSTRKREYARIMLPLMSQTWFHILGWG